MSTIWGHKQQLGIKMGNKAYEASRKAVLPVDRASTLTTHSSGAGHVVSKGQVSTSAMAIVNRVQAGRVFKTCSFKSLNQSPDWAQATSENVEILVPERKQTQSSLSSASASRNESVVSPDFSGQLKPSAECKAPHRSCLKKASSSGSYEPTEKAVCFSMDDEVRVVPNLSTKNPDYHFHHSKGPICYCRKCKRNLPQDPSHHNNTIALEVLALRLRTGISKKEDTVDVDKANLLGQFNKHRMAGEALQGPHRFFLTDLYLSSKSRAAYMVFQKRYDGEEAALELMRHKRRKGTFFKICQREWDWLDLDELAPEIRSSEPRTELDLHWELVEDSQMEGYALGRKANLKRTCSELKIIEANEPEAVKLPESMNPAIRVPRDEISIEMDLDEELEEGMKPVGNIRVRPFVKDVWL